MSDCTGEAAPTWTRDGTLEQRGALILAAGFVIWAGLVAAAHGPLMVDSSVLDTMVAARSPRFTAAAQIITRCGTSLVLLPVTVVVAAWAAWRGRRWLVAALVIVALPVSERVVELIKLLSGRDRPPVALMLGPPAVDPSFPSGHTTSAAFVLGLAALVVAEHSAGRLARWVWLAAAATVILLVGVSRIYLGFHWFSDVIGGWLLAGALTSTALAVGRWHAARIDLAGLPLNRIGARIRCS